MADVECPYCNQPVYICHDDGYGYEEEELHEQECSNCEKTFGYNTHISFSYEVFDVPCFNDIDHDFSEDMHGVPKEFFVGRKRCIYCGKEKIVDIESHQKAMEEYRNKKF